jgi:predicted nucleic acid-binding protein
MTAKFFVDTNILVYATSGAAADQARRDVALDLLDRADLALWAQVLAEFYSVATSKTKLNLTHDDAVVLLKSLERIPVCPITRELVMEAVELRQRFNISYWDAAILAAAKGMGCHTVYSEDLNHGQDYDGVRVVNPFLSTSPTTSA